MTLGFLTGIDNDVKQIMQDWHVPGLALAIIKNGEIVHSKGYGYRDVAREKEVTPDTVFAIGSCSKAFTAAALGILVDEGLLNWDTPIRRYMPDFYMSDPVATERLTARDLLSHRTGLPRHDLMWYNSTATREELVGRVQFLELNKDIRTVWEYNNLMYTVAGYLVEAITGQTWEAFVQTRVFDVLGMDGSNFSVTSSQTLSDFARPYIKAEDGIIEIPFRNLDSIAPAGSINSNLNDMTKWLKLQLMKGRHEDNQVVGEETIAQIHAPHIPVVLPWKFKEIQLSSYGLGWSVESYRGYKFVHHSGGIDGFAAYVSFLPDEGIGSVILTNMNQSYAFSAVAHTIFDRHLGISGKDWNRDVKVVIEAFMEQAAKSHQETIPPRREGTQPSHDLSEYVGIYESPGYGMVDIKETEKGLTLTLNRFEMLLTHHHFDKFSFVHPLFGMFLATFNTQDSGQIGGISIPFDASVKAIQFDRTQT